MHNLVMAYRCTNNGMVVQRTLKRTFTVVSLFLCFAVFAATGLPSHESHRDQSSATVQYAGKEKVVRITGHLEVIGASPGDDDVSGEDDDDMNPTRNDTKGPRRRWTLLDLDDYILMEREDGQETGRWYFLRWDEFPTKRVPISVVTKDVITVRGYFPKNDTTGIVDSQNLVVISINRGPREKEQAVYPVYNSVAGTSPFEVLAILLDFSDSSNGCGTFDTTRGTTRLQNMLWNNSYGYNIAGQYAEMSNGRRTMPFGSSGFRIAGPYLASQFSAGQSCDANYRSWITEARTRATANGFNLADYSTVVVIVPAVTCGWFGRGTLYPCSPGDSTFCFSVSVRCLDYVLSHEIGHNHNLMHSGIDPEDDDIMASNQVYLDWSDIMGNNNKLNKLNSAHMIQMGWLDNNRVLDVTNDPGVFDLCALDAPSATAGALQVLMFTDVSDYPAKQYYFALRARIGYSSFHLSATYADLLNIHSNSEAGNGESRFIRAIGLGSNFVTRVRQWRVDVLSLANNCVRVQLAPCSDPATCRYQWQGTAWSACSTTCGVGSQTRTVTCRDSITNGVVADDWCIINQEIPSTQTCTAACGTTYSWSTGSWSTCSLACNSGTQTRTVTCKGSDNADYATSLCAAAAPAPASSQACNTAACASPTSLSLTAGSITSITASWAAPATGAVSNYRVYYQAGSSVFAITNGLPTVAFVSVAAPTTSVTIPGLTSGVTYFAQVYAEYLPGPVYSAGVTSAGVQLGAAPDATSTLSCTGYTPSSGFEPVGTALTCTIIPRLNGLVVTALASAFVVTASTGNMAIGALSPASGTSLSFTVTATAGHPTGAVTLSCPLTNTVTYTVWDTPTSSTVSCSSTSLALGTSTSCTVRPFRSGVAISAFSSVYALTDGGATGGNGTLTALSPSASASTTFTTTYTANAWFSRRFSISTGGPGAGTVTVTGVATPDASTMACNGGAVGVLQGSTTSCLVTPSLRGQPVWVLSSVYTFTANVSGGSYNSISATPAQSVSVQYVASTPSTGPVRLSDGRGGVYDIIVFAAPAGSSLSCSVPNGGTINTGQVITCTIRPLSSTNTPIYTVGSYFTLSDDAPAVGKGVSSVLPSNAPPSDSFTTTYTAGAASLPISIFTGYGQRTALNTVNLTVVVSPDSTSQWSCTDAAILAGASTTCTFNVSAAGVASWSLASMLPVVTASRGVVSAYTPTGSSPAQQFSLVFTAPSAASLTGVAQLSCGGLLPAISITVFMAPTSSITSCTPSTLSINADSACTVTPYVGATVVTAAIQAFTFSDGGAGGVFTVTPGQFGTALPYTYTAPNVSRVVTLSTGVAGGSASLTVTAVPTSSVMTCTPSGAVLLNTAVTVNLVPRALVNGSPAAVFAFSNAFTMTASGSVGSFGVFSPAAGIASQQFSVTYTTSSTVTSTVTVSSGLGSSCLLNVYAVPTSVQIVCAKVTLSVGSSTSCTLNTLRNGVSAAALGSSLTLNVAGVGGTASALSPSGVASAFTFTYTAPPASAGTATVSTQYPGSASLTIQSLPSGSIVRCSRADVPTSGVLSCNVTATNADGSVTLPASANLFTFSDGGNNGVISALSATADTAVLQFTYTAPSASRRVTLSSGLVGSNALANGQFEVTVTSVANGAQLSCDRSVVYLTGSAVPVSWTMTTCIITPRLGVSTVFTFASQFTVTTTSVGATVSSVTPVVGAANSFSVTFTAPSAPASSGLASVSLLIGGSTVASSAVTVVGVPTSVALSCSNTVLSLNGITSCSVISFVGASQVVSLPDSFALTASAGTVGSVSSAAGVSSSYTFQYTAAAVSGSVTISATAPVTGSTTLNVIGTLTSTVMTCASDRVLVGASTQCTLQTLSAGSPVWVRSSDITFSDVSGASSSAVGSFSGLSPAFGNLFTVTYTATSSGTGPRILSTTVGGTSDTVSVHAIPTGTWLSCFSVVTVGSSMTCTLYPAWNGAWSYAESTAFTNRGARLLSTSAAVGSMTALSPVTVERTFTFTYTATSDLTQTGPTRIFSHVSGTPAWATADTTVIAVPDSSSSVTCTAAFVTVATSLTCTIIPRRLGTVVFAQSSQFVLSETAALNKGNFTMATSTASSFTFTYSASRASQQTTLNVGNSVPGVAITVTARPDVSILTCTSTIAPVNTVFSCTTRATLSGANIFTTPDSFTLAASVAGGTLSSLSPTGAANVFSFTYTPPVGRSDRITITDGIAGSSVQLTTTASPDDCSITCTQSTLEPSASTTCTLNALRLGQPVFADRSAFTLTDTGAGGSFTIIQPTIDQTFSFTYTAAANLVLSTASIRAGVGSGAFSIALSSGAITGALVCAVTNVAVPTALIGGAPLACTITPSRGGSVVTALSSDFSLSIAAGTGSGTFSAISGSGTNSLTFTFTPTATGAVTLSNGKGGAFALTVVATPASQSTMTCSPSDLVLTGATVTCTVVPRASNSAVIFALSSFFSFTACRVSNGVCGLGSFSVLPLTAGTSFTVTFTADATFTGAFQIRSGLPQVTLTAYTTPDSGALTCNGVTAPSTLITPATSATPLSCFIVPRKAGAQVHVLASAFSLSFNGVVQGAVPAFSAFTPAVGAANNFTFQFVTTSLPPQESSISAGFGAQLATTLHGVPDGSDVVCPKTVLALGESVNCTLIPLQGAVPIIALAASPLVLTTSPAGRGTFSPFRQSLGAQLDFTYTASASSDGPFTLLTGPVGNNAYDSIVVTTVATAVSHVVTCAVSSMAVGGATSCTVSPRSATNAVVFALASAVTMRDLRVIGGTSLGGVFGTVSPAVGNSFSVTYTAPSTAAAAVQLTVGTTLSTVATVANLTLTAVPQSSVLSFPSVTNGLVLAGSAIAGTLSPRLADGTTVIFSLATHYGMVGTVGSGSFNAVTPAGVAANAFSVTFTSASAFTGPVTLSDGRGGSFSYVQFAAPAATSTVQCASAAISTGATVNCWIVPRSAGGAVITSRSLYFSLSGAADGVFSALNTSTATLFGFTFTAGATPTPINTPLQLSCGVAGTSPFSLTVLPPVLPGVITCSSTSMAPAATVSCNFTTATATLASSFSLSSNGAGGSFGPIDPANTPATIFTFSYTAPSVAPASGSVTLSSSSGGSLALSVSVPGGSSTVTGSRIWCDDSDGFIRTGTSMTCYVEPQNNGAPVSARASDLSFTSSGAPLTLGALSPSSGLASVFSLTVTAGAVTGDATLFSGVGGQLPLVVYAVPNSVDITCDQSRVTAGDSTSCTLIPRLDGTPVVALSSAMVITVTGTSDGTVSAILPSFGNSFSFTYSTTSSTSGRDVISVSPGVESATVYSVMVPDGMSFFRCAASSMDAGSSILCTFSPRRIVNGVMQSIVAVGPFSLSDGVAGGTWDGPLTGNMEPSIGDTFTVTYTARAGVSRVTTLTITGLASVQVTVKLHPTTVGISCSLTRLYAGQTMTCSITPRVPGSLGSITTVFADIADLSPVSVNLPAAAYSMTPLAASSGNSFGNGFTFSFGILTGAPSQVFQITFPVPGRWEATVVMLPDSTSTMSCDTNAITAGQVSTCSITAMRAGAPIFSLPSSFSASVSDPAAGRVSALTTVPRAGTVAARNFTFTFTSDASYTGGSPIIWDGISSRRFTMIVSAQVSSFVSAFTLMDATSGLELRSVYDGDSVILAEEPADQLNIRADISEVLDFQGSVRFDLTFAPFNADGTLATELTSSSFSVDNEAPYAVMGDINGNYLAWAATPGKYVIQARPFSGKWSTGTAYDVMQLALTVRSTAPPPPAPVDPSSTVSSTGDAGSDGKSSSSSTGDGSASSSTGPASSTADPASSSSTGGDGSGGSSSSSTGDNKPQPPTPPRTQVPVVSASLYVQLSQSVLNSFKMSSSGKAITVPLSFGARLTIAGQNKGSQVQFRLIRDAVELTRLTLSRDELEDYAKRNVYSLWSSKENLRKLDIGELAVPFAASLAASADLSFALSTSFRSISVAQLTSDFAKKPAKALGLASPSTLSSGVEVQKDKSDTLLKLEFFIIPTAGYPGIYLLQQLLDTLIEDPVSLLYRGTITRGITQSSGTSIKTVDDVIEYHVVLADQCSDYRWTNSGHCAGDTVTDSPASTGGGVSTAVIVSAIVAGVVGLLATGVGYKLYQRKRTAAASRDLKGLRSHGSHVRSTSLAGPEMEDLEGRAVVSPAIPHTPPTLQSHVTSRSYGVPLPGSGGSSQSGSVVHARKPSRMAIDISPAPDSLASPAAGATASPQNPSLIDRFLQPTGWDRFRLPAVPVAGPLPAQRGLSSISSNDGSDTEMASPPRRIHAALPPRPPTHTHLSPAVSSPMYHTLAGASPATSSSGSAASSRPSPNATTGRPSPASSSDRHHSPVTRLDSSDSLTGSPQGSYSHLPDIAASPDRQRAPLIVVTAESTDESDIETSTDLKHAGAKPHVTALSKPLLSQAGAQSSRHSKRAPAQPAGMRHRRGVSHAQDWLQSSLLSSTDPRGALARAISGSPAQLPVPSPSQDGSTGRERRSMSSGNAALQNSSKAGQASAPATPANAPGRSRTAKRRAAKQRHMRSFTALALPDDAGTYDPLALSVSPQSAPFDAVQPSPPLIDALRQRSSPGTRAAAGNNGARVAFALGDAPNLELPQLDEHANARPSSQPSGAAAGTRVSTRDVAATVSSSSNTSATKRLLHVLQSQHQ